MLFSVWEPTALQPRVVEIAWKRSPGLRLDMAEHMILILSLRPVQSPVLGGAFEPASDSLPDVDMLHAAVVLVVFDIQRHCAIPDSVPFDPRDALVFKDIVAIGVAQTLAL